MGNLSTKSIGLHFCLHVGDCLYGIFYRKNGIYSLHNSFHIFTNCLFWLKPIVFFSLTWATLKIKNGSSRKRTFMKNDKINKKAKNGKTEKQKKPLSFSFEIVFQQLYVHCALRACSQKLNCLTEVFAWMTNVIIIGTF